MMYSNKHITLTHVMRQIRTNERGAAAIEFAILLPVFIAFFLGMLDAGYYLYNRVQLDGAMAKASRDSSLENNIGVGATAVDNKVKDLMGIAAKSATFEFKRQSFSNFSTAKRMEPWVDNNSDGICNNGEPYEDVNNSNSWDRGGKSGQGGAKDVVVYEVIMTYPQFFPTHLFTGQENKVTISAKTLISNQPYTQQVQAAAGPQRNCS